MSQSFIAQYDPQKIQEDVLQILAKQKIKGTVDENGDVNIDLNSLEHLDIFLQGSTNSKVRVMLSNMNENIFYILAEESYRFTDVEDETYSEFIALACNSSHNPSKIMIGQHGVDISYECPPVNRHEITESDLMSGLYSINSMQKAFVSISDFQTRQFLSSPRDILDLKTLKVRNMSQDVKDIFDPLYLSLKKESNHDILMGKLKKTLEFLKISYKVDEEGDIQFAYDQTAYYIHPLSANSYKLAAFNLFPDSASHIKHPYLASWLNESNRLNFGKANLKNINDVEVSFEHVWYENHKVEDHAKTIESWLLYFGQHIKYFEQELRKKL